MSIEATLETKLLAEFDPQRLKIDNDSKTSCGAGDREPLSGHYRFRGLYGGECGSAPAPCLHLSCGGARWSDPRLAAEVPDA